MRPTGILTVFGGLLLLPLAGSGEQAPAQAPVQPKQVQVQAPEPSLFSLVGPDYKRPQEVPDTFFNPFKISGAGPAAQKRGGAATADTVAGAIGSRGVTGVFYDPAKRASRVIIGDQVFVIGEELAFPDDKGGAAPLVTGASVILREVGNDNLGFDFSPDGEAAHRINFPLHAFWQP